MPVGWFLIPQQSIPLLEPLFRRELIDMKRRLGLVIAYNHNYFRRL
jgi:hypothetical protein